MFSINKDNTINYYFQVLAKNKVIRIRMSKNARVDFLVTRIQKIVRKRLAWLKVFRLRKERGDFDTKSKGNRKKIKDKGNSQETVISGML